MLTLKREYLEEAFPDSLVRHQPSVGPLASERTIPEGANPARPLMPGTDTAMRNDGILQVEADVEGTNGDEVSAAYDWPPEMRQWMERIKDMAGDEQSLRSGKGLPPELNATLRVFAFRYKREVDRMACASDAILDELVNVLGSSIRRSALKQRLERDSMQGVHQDTIGSSNMDPQSNYKWTQEMVEWLQKIRTQAEQETPVEGLRKIPHSLKILVNKFAKPFAREVERDPTAYNAVVDKMMEFLKPFTRRERLRARLNKYADVDVEDDPETPYGAGAKLYNQNYEWTNEMRQWVERIRQAAETETPSAGMRKLPPALKDLINGFAPDFVREVEREPAASNAILEELMSFLHPFTRRDRLKTRLTQCTPLDPDLNEARRIRAAEKYDWPVDIKEWVQQIREVAATLTPQPLPGKPGQKNLPDSLKDAIRMFAYPFDREMKRSSVASRAIIDELLSFLHPFCSRANLMKRLRKDILMEGKTKTEDPDSKDVSREVMDDSRPGSPSHDSLPEGTGEGDTADEGGYTPPPVPLINYPCPLPIQPWQDTPPDSCNVAAGAHARQPHGGHSQSEAPWPTRMAVESAYQLQQQAAALAQQLQGGSQATSQAQTSGDARETASPLSLNGLAGAAVAVLAGCPSASAGGTFRDRAPAGVLPRETLEAGPLRTGDDIPELVVTTSQVGYGGPSRQEQQVQATAMQPLDPPATSNLLGAKGAPEYHQGARQVAGSVAVVADEEDRGVVNSSVWDCPVMSDVPRQECLAVLQRLREVQQQEAELAVLEGELLIKKDAAVGSLRCTLSKASAKLNQREAELKLRCAEVAQRRGAIKCIQEMDADLVEIFGLADRQDDNNKDKDTDAAPSDGRGVVTNHHNYVSNNSNNKRQRTEEPD